MNQIPRTMTETGLAFLTALAAKAGQGVFLEIGPLFGSSTQAIAAGRSQPSISIHTIDTFDPAPWVRRRFGFDLSRAVFDRFNSDIPGLVVHQGFAPDIVRHSWKERIGFYFDDATHGDPGWTANFSFFEPHFAPDALICGDDFASGWPDILRNVRNLAQKARARLFVMGRVWAFTLQDDERIIAAIDQVCPQLRGIQMTTRNARNETTLPAAVWSAGLHLSAPVEELAIGAQEMMQGQIVTFRKGRVQNMAAMTGETISLAGADQIYIGSDKSLKIQYCLTDATGNTANTKAIRMGQIFDIPSGHQIVAVRLCQ